MTLRVALSAMACVLALTLSGCIASVAHDDRTSVAIGDGTYLDGMSYLRGVNVYTLEQQRDLPSSKVVGDPQESFDYLASRGFSIVRLAVPWQGVIPIPDAVGPKDALSGPVDHRYLDIISNEVAEAARAGLRTVIDLHNDCRYPWAGAETPSDAVSCGSGIGEDDAARIWTVLSTRFRDDARVAAYDIFNEPKIGLTVPVYERFAQVAVDAIRATGDNHTVWVEGMTGSQGALAKIASVGPWIHDPLNAIVYSQHFYLAKGRAGSDLLDRLRQFGDWCQKWSVHCSVGEVGWFADATDPTSAIFSAFYSLADEYRMDVTYFGTSSRSSQNLYWAYVADGESSIDTTRPQSAIIEAHLGR